MKLSEKEFLETELSMGIGFHNPLFVQLAAETIKQIENLDIKTIIDFGAGTGVYAQQCANKGFETFAVDLSQEHINYMKENTKGVKLIKRLKEADLMLFIEVAEHMQDSEIIEAVSKIKPKYILFSSTSESASNDEEWGHINIKSQSEWIKFWQVLNYKLEKDLNYPTNYTKLLKREESH